MQARVADRLQVPSPFGLQPPPRASRLTRRTASASRHRCIYAIDPNAYQSSASSRTTIKHTEASSC
ncbi:hypothetical protein PsYK624_047610 [Phanerochaete sordida]|uniref:Uncharacterized protein n=1 Tax=Phanerochaete sordida TaxID=48140 RepID=A0A9P3LC13_9APHY|nr:hypothetical protein PsYK624_047610 [Phanerochaete sordida]